jgi:hypothetical protein
MGAVILPEDQELEGTVHNVTSIVRVPDSHEGVNQDFNEGNGYGARSVAQAEQRAEPTQQDDIPEQYHGKSVAHIARETESAKQIAERQRLAFVDMNRRALAAHDSCAEQPPEKEMDDVDFFANPKDTIRKAIENHPAVRELTARAQRESREKATAEFGKAHPDARELLRDREFQAWVKASPIRQQLLARAHTQYDTAAADHIFSTYKALKGRTAKNAGTDGQKIYRRSDVQRIMEENPERYEQIADEIGRAYRERRVR